MRKLLVLFLGVVVFASCNNEMTTAPTQEQAEELMKNIGFVSAKQRLSDMGVIETDSTAGFKVNSKYRAKEEDKGLVIFNATIASPRKECKTGFGLCDVVIVGIPIGPQSEDFKNKLTQTLEQYDCTTFLESNTVEGDYVEFQLKGSPSSGNISIVPDFQVDEILEKPITSSTISQTITIDAGAYPYDPSIGNFGGYRIPVKLSQP